MFSSINHKAVIITAIGVQILHFIWYSPYLFFDSWIKAQGILSEDYSRDGILFFYSTIAMLLSAYFIAWLLPRLGIINGAQGIQFMILFMFFGVAPIIFTYYSFLHISYKVYLIDMGNLLINAAFIGYILGSWQKHPYH